MQSKKGKQTFLPHFWQLVREFSVVVLGLEGGKDTFLPHVWHRILQEKIQLENSGNLVLGLEGGKDTFLQQFLHEILQEKILVKQ